MIPIFSSLPLLFLVLLVLLVLTVHASPPHHLYPKRDDTDPRDRFPTGARIIVNGFDWPLSLNKRLTTEPIDPPTDIVRAAVKHAPPFFTCFFSSPLGFPSRTFTHYHDLTEGYAAAASITCQTLLLAPSSMYVVWVRYEDGREGVFDVFVQRSGDARVRVGEDGSGGGGGYGWEKTQSGKMGIVAAMVMESPGGSNECMLVSGNGDGGSDYGNGGGSEEGVVFSEKQPWSGEALSAVAIKCYRTGRKGQLSASSIGVGLTG